MTQNPGALKTATTVAAGRRPVFCRRLCSWLSACFLVVSLCSFRLQFLVAEQSQCTTGKSVLQLDAKGNDPVTFSCESGVEHLYPPPPSTSGVKKVCETSDCTNAVDFTLADVTWEPQSTGGSITATSVQQASTIYVKCTSATQTVTLSRDGITPVAQKPSEKNCTVQISIWGPPKRGSGYPEHNNDTLSLEVTSASQSVTFACGNNQYLTPELFDKVFTADTFRDQVRIKERLAGASLVKHATTAGTDNPPAYTLTVPQLPAQPTTLYYKCRKTGDKQDASQDCNVVIQVAKAEDGGEASGTSSETTTISPETSGSSAGKWSTTLIASVFSVSLVLTTMW
ncbi:SRS domain-containing protein [Neospora caninum Liverpool]|uniref:SRS domain-containing protein n=1 Tax=Neospora caninum (strain Liverpool) TaxID=572307 RepID=F0VKJ5_NEOCL|nr:SRS domain-containing protein [Neospora caninum Liverpool]CBZ54596.1 SRS domain-containing protein [Neospora caninum Liverpool]CEL69310.1 TPA: SRS domain-containing protein [Neospora caninum Liverpool]|eukprot:XP_003884626.1 SRS domain-containing protein [Neospora caninum Liverpool]